MIFRWRAELPAGSAPRSSASSLPWVSALERNEDFRESHMPLGALAPCPCRWGSGKRRDRQLGAGNFTTPSQTAADFRISATDGGRLSEGPKAGPIADPRHQPPGLRLMPPFRTLPLGGFDAALGAGLHTRCWVEGPRVSFGNVSSDRSEVPVEPARTLDLQQLDHRFSACRQRAAT